MTTAPSSSQLPSGSPSMPLLSALAQQLWLCTQTQYASFSLSAQLALDTLYTTVLQMCREQGEVLLDLSPPCLIINHMTTRDILPPEQQEVLFQHFYRISLRRLRLTANTTRQDLGTLLSHISVPPTTTDPSPSLAMLEQQLPSIQLSFLPPPLVLTPSSPSLSALPASPQRSPSPNATQQRPPSSLAHTESGSFSALSTPNPNHPFSPFPEPLRSPTSVPWPLGFDEPSGIGPLPEDPSGIVPLPPPPLLQQTGSALPSETSALAQIQRNPLWLYSKEAYTYFLQRFATQQQLSQRLSTPNTNPYVLLNTAQVQRDIAHLHQEIAQLVTLLPESKHLDRLYRLSGQILLSLHPSLINQHLLLLSNPQHPLVSWRNDLLFQCNTHQIQLLQHELLRHFEHITDENQLPPLLGLMQEFINYLYLRNFEENLLLFLDRLSKTQAIYRADLQIQWQTQILRFVTAPHHLHPMFERARQPGNELTQQLLTQLIAQSLPYGIRQLPGIRLTQQHEEQIALLLLIAFHAPPEAREQTLRDILAHLEHLPDLDTQEFCFTLCHYFAPGLLESYIDQRLLSIQDPRLRQRLLQHAVACDTLPMQNLLKQLLEQDLLASEPNQEEWLLAYLHRCRTIDAISFLQQRIFDPQKDTDIRHNAIWMLGAFPNKKTLALLEHIIISESTEVREHGLPFQAIHTLSRFAFPETRTLLESIRKRPSLLEYAHVQQLLHENIPSSLSSLQQEYPAFSSAELPHQQQFLRRVWLILIVGIFSSFLLLTWLYLNGWFDALFR